MKKTTPKKRTRRLITVAVIICLAVAAFYKGLTTVNYTVKSDKLDAAQTLNIVVITDLHSGIYGTNQELLINAVKRQNPDLIFLVGDIADHAIPITGTSLLLAGIKDVAPIYYVTGNHEYMSGNYPAIHDELVKYGVTVLSDTFVKTEINGVPLIIAGIEDPDASRAYARPGYTQKAAMDQYFADFGTAPEFTVLLAHRPELIDSYREYGFDLVVSGHTHGGQVRIPFILNGLYAPDQGWFPRYAGGLYTHGELTHIVSRGLALNAPIPRIFNPPELVVITLVAK